MKFLHINLESIFSETDKCFRSSKTKKNMYLFNNTFNKDETTLLNFRYKKQKKKVIIKPIYTNPPLLSTSLWDQQQSAQKRNYKHQYWDIILKVCKD